MTPYSPTWSGSPYGSHRLGDRIMPIPARSSPASPGPRMGADIAAEIKNRAWEFEEPLNYLFVDTAWVAGDLVAHQWFEATEGDKTPPGYYGNKWLYGIPFLLAGRLVSERVVGGPPLARAFTIGTTANLLMQGNYLLSGLSSEFNWIVFLVHEALLVPLSLILVRDPRAPKY